MKPEGGSVKRLARRMKAEILPKEPCSLLLAVSGGADSVFLARAMAMKAARRSWNLLLGHVHHGIRGAEADEDEASVLRLGEELGLEVMCARLDPHSLDFGALDGNRGEVGDNGINGNDDKNGNYRKQEDRRSSANRASPIPPIFPIPSARGSKLAGAGTSLEGRLRLARWGVLAAMARARECRAIMAAHNQDDAAETFLLQALRGAGLEGLGSLRERGDWEGVEILRPMLDLSAAEIRQALREDGFAWREDSTNQDSAFKRNWIRHEILPRIEEHSPGAGRALARTARICAEEAEALKTLGAEALANLRPSFAPFAPFAPFAIPQAAAPFATLLNAGRLFELGPAIRRRALRAWAAEFTQRPLAPSRNAILQIESAAKSARQDGGERWSLAISGWAIWTDGRWLAAAPSPNNTRKFSEKSLHELILPTLLHWRQAWGLTLLSPECLAQNRPPPDSTQPDSLSQDCMANCAKIRLPSSNIIANDGSEIRSLSPILARRIEGITGGDLSPWRKALENGQAAIFDAREIEAPENELLLRPVRPGDTLELPGGMRKDAREALAESHIPLPLRPLVLILLDAKGPLWLVSVKRSNRARIGPDTRSAWLIEAVSKHSLSSHASDPDRIE